MSTTPSPWRAWWATRGLRGSTAPSRDVRILALLTAQPQIGVLGASRALGVARGTVQARLDRLVSRGVIGPWAPRLDPAALGFPVSAFCALEIRQGEGHSPVVEHLATVPEASHRRGGRRGARRARSTVISLVTELPWDTARLLASLSDARS